jgi:hypothetical protein
VDHARGGGRGLVPWWSLAPLTPTLHHSSELGDRNGWKDRYRRASGSELARDEGGATDRHRGPEPVRRDRRTRNEIVRRGPASGRGRVAWRPLAVHAPPRVETAGGQLSPEWGERACVRFGRPKLLEGPRLRGRELPRRARSELMSGSDRAPNCLHLALDAILLSLRICSAPGASRPPSQRRVRAGARAERAGGVATPGSRSRFSVQSRAFGEGRKSRAMLRS